jgi:S1-C subfamily serine protease
LASVIQEPKSEDQAPRVVSGGSGFFVSPEGHILTNHHVVEECREVRIGADTKANVVASDINVDLALLKGPKTDGTAVRFREGRGIRPGDEVVGAGYPLQGFLTTDLSITTGIVSALAGPGNDRRLIQISAPVQPGNSGGPLLDLSGNLVGIIVGKLDAIKVAQATGDIPQNVNFAISALSARAFLDSQAVRYETAPSEVQHSAADVAAMARQYTVRIECWN